MLQMCVLLFSFIFFILNFIFKAMYYVLKNCFLANFLLISIGGSYFFTHIYAIELTYSIPISIGIAVVIVLMMLKLKYIRIVLLSGFGAVWGYALYSLMADIINIPGHPKISFACAAAFGILYLIGHVKQGLDLGSKGDVYDPIGWIFTKTRLKEIADKYTKANDNDDMMIY